VQKRNLIAIGIFIIFYVGFGIYLTLSQEKVIYQPFAQDFDSCDAFAEVEKVNQAGTRMYVSGTDKPVVVLYHGNAGSACDRWFYADTFKQAGYDFVIVEYSGYSNDLVAPSHKRTKANVKNVIAFLSERDVDDVSIVGESLGAGTASYHASIAPPEKLLLISPFKDLASAAGQKFWFYPTSLLVDNAFDNVEKLSGYGGRVTIIHGEKDRLASFSLSQELFTSINTEKEFIEVTGAGHNDLFLFDQAFQGLTDFLAK
jgi:pimeloyl-ACP methyl ester carboxylesterase